MNTRKEEQTMKTTKTVLAALWRLGRSTATMMGLAMLLALSVGLASTALAGTGIGARFDLGKTNTVNAVSKLVGNVAGPSLPDRQQLRQRRRHGAELAGRGGQGSDEGQPRGRHGHQPQRRQARRRARTR